LRLLAGLEDSATRTHPTPWKTGDRPGIDRGVVFPGLLALSLDDPDRNVVLAICKAHPQLERKERRELAEEYLELVGLADAHGKYRRSCQVECASVGRLPGRWPWARPCC